MERHHTVLRIPSLIRLQQPTLHLFIQLSQQNNNIREQHSIIEPSPDDRLVTLAHIGYLLLGILPPVLVLALHRLSNDAMLTSSTEMHRCKMMELIELALSHQTCRLAWEAADGSQFS